MDNRAIKGPLDSLTRLFRKDHHTRPTPYDSTLKVTTASKDKPELRQGSLIVDEERPAWLDKPEIQSFFKPVLNKAKQHELAKQDKNSAEIHLEKSQDLDSALSTEKQNIVDFIESLYEYIPSRKDPIGQNKDAETHRQAENYTRQLMNETFSLIGQYTIGNFRPFSFIDTKEFRELQDLMLNQGYSKNDERDIKRLKDALQKITEADEVDKIKKYWNDFKEIIVKQIAKADQRLKEAQENIKKYEKIPKTYQNATIRDNPLQAGERAANGKRIYIPRATEFVKKLNEFAGQEHEKQGEKLVQQAKIFAEEILEWSNNGYRQQLRVKLNNYESCINDLNTLIKTNGEGAVSHLRGISSDLAAIRTTTVEGNSTEEVKKSVQEQVTKFNNQIKEQIYQIEEYAKQAKEFAEKENFFKVQVTGVGTKGKIAKDVTKLSQEVEQLEKDMAAIAELSDKAAKAIATQQKKQANGNFTGDDLAESIKKEKKYRELEKNLLEEAIRTQETLTKKLDTLLSVEPGDDLHIKAVIARYSNDLIKDAEEKSRELQERKIELEKIPSSADDDWKGGKKAIAARARNLAEQYNQRAKRTMERVKQYEEQLDISKKDVQQDNLAHQHINNALKNAEKIAKLEKELRDLHLNIAQKADSGNINNNDGIIQNTTILLDKIRNEYEAEKTSVGQITNYEKSVAESAKTDRDALLQFRKRLENPAPNLITVDQTNISDALIHNSSYIERKINENKKRVRDVFEALRGTSKSEDIDSMQALSRAHIVMDNVNGGWASINGIYVQLREIRSLKHDKETGVTTIQWREDIPEITVFGEINICKKIFRY